LLATDIGKLLNDHNGGDVVVMDMRSLNFWTDFFVIATTTSSTHLRGLERHIKEFARQKEVDILHRSRRPKSNVEQQPDEWCLLDMGTIVIHLMSSKVRSFFELERLWSAAPVIRVEGLIPKNSLREGGSAAYKVLNQNTNTL